MSKLTVWLFPLYFALIVGGGWLIITVSTSLCP